MKDDDEVDSALYEIWWHLESCVEAEKIFDDHYQCPVCLEYAQDSGILIHKNPELLFN